MKINATLVGLTVLSLALLGCGKQKVSLTGVSIPSNPLELEVRNLTLADKNGVVLDVASLQPEDVIVAINGYPLTKKVYDDYLVIKAKGLMEDKRTNQLVAQKVLEEYRKSVIRTFVGQRLMVDNAFELGLVTTNAVVDHVRSKIAEAVAAKKISADVWQKSLGFDPKYLYYETALALAMSKVIDAKISSYDEVDEKFAQAVQRQVESDNAASVRTKEMIRARLVDWKQQIEAKKLDFAKVVKTFSQADDSENGVWGTFEEGEMDDKRIEAAVFALKKGQISNVLEDEDGFHLVKVIDVIPPEKNESGRIVSRERRTLSRVYLEKYPLIIRQSDKEMLTDLRQQFRVREINAYIAKLQTNGVNKVVYPNGIPVFK